MTTVNEFIEMLTEEHGDISVAPEKRGEMRVHWVKTFG